MKQYELNGSIKMNKSHDLFMIFLKCQSGSCVDCQWRDRNVLDFIKITSFEVSKQGWKDTKVSK